MAEIPAGHRYHLIDGLGGQWLAETTDEFPEPTPIGSVDNILRDASRLAARASIQRQFFEECETAGWDPEKKNSFGEEIAHLHEELTEAFKQWRIRKDTEIWFDDEEDKPQGVPIEFADVLIGMFYNAELHEFDLLAAAEIKHQWNLTRSYPAEGRQLHPAATDPSDGGGVRG